MIQYTNILIETQPSSCMFNGNSNQIELLNRMWKRIASVLFPWITKTITSWCYIILVMFNIRNWRFLRWVQLAHGYLCLFRFVWCWRWVIAEHSTHYVCLMGCVIIGSRQAINKKLCFMTKQWLWQQLKNNNSSEPWTTPNCHCIDSTQHCNNPSLHILMKTPSM